MSAFKVVDDGTFGGLGVKITAPDGEDITGKVRSFNYSHMVGEPAVLRLEVIGAEIDVTAMNAEFREFAATGK